MPNLALPCKSSWDPQVTSQLLMSDLATSFSFLFVDLVSDYLFFLTLGAESDNKEQVWDNGESDVEVKTFKVHRRKKRSDRKKKEGSGEKSFEEKGVQVIDDLQAQVMAVAGPSEFENFKKMREKWMPRNMIMTRGSEECTTI